MGKIGVECCLVNFEGLNLIFGFYNYVYCNIFSKCIIYNLIVKSCFFFVFGNYLDVNILKEFFNIRIRISNYGWLIEICGLNNVLRN